MSSSGHRRYWRDGLLEANPASDRRRAHPDRPGRRGDRSRARRRRGPRARLGLRHPSARRRRRSSSPSRRCSSSSGRCAPGPATSWRPTRRTPSCARRSSRRSTRPAAAATRSTHGGRSTRRAATSSACSRRRAAPARRRCRPTSRPGLALEAPGEVVIVDLDFQFGDVASALRMTPEHTFADITPLDRSRSTSRRSRSSSPPSDDGLFALCAPESPVDADAITPAAGAARGVAARVRVPLRGHRHRFRASTRPRSRSSSSAPTSSLLTSTDVPSVRATRKEVEMLDLLGLTDQTRHFVVNRADARVGLPVSEVEATVGHGRPTSRSRARAPCRSR